MTVTAEVISSDIDSIWGMEIDKLYSNLGFCSIGNESIDETIMSTAKVFGAAENEKTEEAKQSILAWIINKGKQFFVTVWEQVKGIACQVYHSGADVDDGKDLAEYLISAVLTSLAKFSSPIVTLVVSIAVKRGLDSLCPLEPAAP